MSVRAPVTIIVPVYGGSAHTTRCFESIVRHADGARVPFELLVVPQRGRERRRRGCEAVDVLTRRLVGRRVVDDEELEGNARAVGMVDDALETTGRVREPAVHRHDDRDGRRTLMPSPGRAQRPGSRPSPRSARRPPWPTPGCRPRRRAAGLPRCGWRVPRRRRARRQRVGPLLGPFHGLHQEVRRDEPVDGRGRGGGHDAGHPT